jgi:mono/diheme cytochrome c family protein
MAPLQRIIALSLVLLSLGAPGKDALATNQTDPVQDLIGEWDVPGSPASITIKANHVVMHYRLGRGDIKWDNADYYNINFRQRTITCHYIVRVYSETDIEFVRAENLDLPECDLGKVRRPPPPPPDLTQQGSPSAGAVIAEPEEPLAKAAFKALDKHCARCHQNGRLSGRGAPAQDFGNILKFDEIAGNVKYVLPGNGHGSGLVDQIVNGKRHWAEGSSGDPAKEDIDAIIAWIDSLGKTAGTNCRPVIGNKELVSLIAKDLDSSDIPQSKKSATRYLTLTNIYNACAGEKTLEIYRQGAIKLVNSLTRLPNVAKVAPIDPAKTILRINISDLGWSAADWEKILAAYPYATRPTDTVHNRTIEDVTGTKLAYVRADWFAFTASRPPLYNRLLRLPATAQELDERLNADIGGDIAGYRAKRAGFQTSAVAQHNRLIERHPLSSGYLWRSYDFASDDGDKNLFEHPLGPEGPKGFRHDANATIFTLPNGFQGYFLNDGEGRAIEKAPPDILHDGNRVSDNRDPSVVTGISCMGCHGNGMREAKDEVRSRVLNAKELFPRAVSEAVAALYPESPELNELIAGDTAAFKSALTKAGVAALADSGGDIVYALSSQYERPLTQQVAAAEFGMTADEFSRSAAARAEGPNRLLVNLLSQGKAPRDRFEKAFASLAKEIAGDEVVAPEEAPIPVARYEPPAALTVTVTADKAFYRKDDKAVFTVVASQDCYLTFLNVDQKGAATVIFPNKHQQDNRIRANASVKIPDDQADFDFKLNDRGTETLIAICTEKNVPVDGIVHDFKSSTLTEVPNYTGAIARSITAEKRIKPGAQAAPPAPSNASRAAIKVQVR